MKNKDLIKAIAIGGFDGMHLAHQELFKNLGEDGAIVSIETGYANLTPKNYRQEYTTYPIFYYELDDIKNLSGEEFINLLKNEFKNLQKIVVGFDFCFGKNRANSVNDLENFFDKQIVIVPEISLNDKAIHSRYIREFLKQGDIKQANSFLGKEYKIFGKKIAGQGLGAKEFVPTINLDVKEFLLPKSGVYLTKTILNSKSYNSLTFIGHRKTTDDNFAVETHILEPFADSFDENIQIEFIGFLRQNLKFDSFAELKNKIEDDIKFARNFFY